MSFSSLRHFDYSELYTFNFYLKEVTF